MIANRNRRPRPLATTTITIMVMALAGAGGAQAATPPVKLVPSLHITNGFEFNESVAVAPGGNIYVADAGNRRVQELTSTGVFVSMFGDEVNQTTGGNICTAASGNVCKAGVVGTGGGEFGAEGPQSVVVDQNTANVYVQDFSNWRIQEFTAAGEFVLMFGKEVNETTKVNVCTAEEITKSGVKCKTGVRAATATAEPGAFNFAHGRGNLLAVGPAPEHLLYVGDELRVQEFDAAGESKGEIPLTSISAEPENHVVALAVDQATGDVYLAYGSGLSNAEVVRVFDTTGKEQRSFQVAPLNAGAKVDIRTLALDGAGQLAVSAGEEGGGPFGELYAAATGHLITGFTNPEGSPGLAFNGEPEAEMYAVQRNQVVLYKPLHVAELLTTLSSCEPGPELETSVTLDCSLNGTVNPESVAETEVFMQWGRTQAFGETTPKQTFATVTEPKAVSAPVEGVRPNQTFFYRLVGEDQNVKFPEQLTSETASFTTPIVPAKIPGVPGVSFVKSSSAVLSSALNPENANTEYFFEYGQHEALAPCPGVREPGGCPGVASTPVGRSSVYGKISTTLEAKELQPATLYSYRLSAEGENVAGTERRQSEGAEATFTTAPAPVGQAVTGAPGVIGATSATVSGTVNPDGLPATYTFELGVYEGPGTTQYGVVFSGSAGAGSVPVGESLLLTGLQPGTTYAYRIAVKAGRSNPVQGEAVTFTTAGLPLVLAVPTPLAMLAVPNIAFPAEPKPGKPAACKRGYKRDKRGRCAKPRKKAKAKGKKGKGKHK
jgi:hypothetical protein